MLCLTYIQTEGYNSDEIYSNSPNQKEDEQSYDEQREVNDKEEDNYGKEGFRVGLGITECNRKAIQDGNNIPMEVSKG